MLPKVCCADNAVIQLTRCWRHLASSHRRSIDPIIGRLRSIFVCEVLAQGMILPVISRVPTSVFITACSWRPSTAFKKAKNRYRREDRLGLRSVEFWGAMHSRPEPRLPPRNQAHPTDFELRWI